MTSPEVQAARRALQAARLKHQIARFELLCAVRALEHALDGISSVQALERALGFADEVSIFHIKQAG